MEYSKHDICLVNFNPAKGGEMGKLRPAIIVSSDEDNALLSTVIVIPLSTEIEPDALPYRYTLQSREKLNQDSDACINEIRALSKSRVKERLASLSKEEAVMIQKALCDLLGN
ncbi:MAG: type II toxin-antitoxin system PemK/MazF family toxin [Campylobacterales bacterium]|nr:type II toxin-antitoxin system PemK/MazF family toxin [Campylobacterales bacterium]